MGEAMPSHELERPATPELAIVEETEHKSAIVFEFNPSFFVGTDNTEVATDGPLRGTLSAIGKAVPELSHLTSHAARQRHRQRVASYLGSSVKVREFGPHQYEQQFVQLKRHEVIDLEDATLSVLTTLAEQNDPVVDALKQIEAEFGDVMNDQTLYELSTEVLFYTHWQEMRDVLKAQVDGQR